MIKKLLGGIFAADPRLTPADKLVLISVAHAVNERRRDGLAWPSQKRIGKETGLNRRTVRLAIDRLLDLKYLVETKGWTRTSSREYRLDLGRGTTYPLKGRGTTYPREGYARPKGGVPGTPEQEGTGIEQEEVQAATAVLHVQASRTEPLTTASVQAPTVFAKLTDGSWGLRGHELRTGQSVEVHRRDGTRETCVVGDVVQRRSNGEVLARKGEPPEPPSRIPDAEQTSKYLREMKEVH